MLHGVGELLITTAVGYWVLSRADDQKGEMRRIGRFLGVVIIVVSLVGLICAAWNAIGGDAWCSMGKGGGLCPFMGKPRMHQPR